MHQAVHKAAAVWARHPLLVVADPFRHATARLSDRDVAEPPG
jgi:hypothetical protein